MAEFGFLMFGFVAGLWTGAFLLAREVDRRDAARASQPPSTPREP